MRNLLTLLGFALVAFLAVGWYLGWYQVTPKSPTTQGHSGWEVDINSKKIGDDVNRGIKAGEEKIHDVLDKDRNSPPASTPR